MPRIRTFIAVELSPRVITRAGNLIDQLRVSGAEVNWVRPQQMHLTLKFLGDVPDTETPEICNLVTEVAADFEPFEIVFRGAGAFPHISQPRTLWIGIADGAEELTRLWRAIDDAFKKQLGYVREHRGFHPHLTIGRVKRELPGAEGELGKLLEQHAHFDADLAIMDEVVTFSSNLGRQGPTHEAMGRAPLGGK